MYKLVLPKPVSVNALYATNASGKKYVTKVGREWFKWAGQEIIVQVGRREMIKGPVRVWIYMKLMNVSDTDNLLKATYDLLKPVEKGEFGMGLIEDDRYIYDGRQRKIPVRHSKDEQIIVTIEPVSQEELEQFTEEQGL